ncbi:ECF RNA polymerase sigma factor SigK [Frigoribacterium sp. 2-23]|uniref:ECF RNA polymerase sigma factor SigK n=1 Tax=Frigoribacterium sp. 2-23 TaxID=3415006 RepID=UPI003C6F11C0
MPAVPHLLDRDQTDEVLLALAADGQHAPFAQFYDRAAPRVLGIVQRVLVDRAQAEEVTQEVFLETWQHAARFDPAKGKALSWVLTMAHRRAIDRVRASQSSRDRDLTIGIRDFTASSDDVAHTAETRLEHARVTRALGSLTAFQREALELVYFGGLTHSEAARHADVALGTMKTRLRDGLIALRRVLAPAEAA